MKNILRNIFAILIGVLIGGIINMGIIMISPSIIPSPDGADVTTMEGLKASIHLFQPKHFIFPFLAHAIGTLIGAMISAIIAVNHKMKFALGVGVFFLIGGIMNVFILPSPTWFIVVDLLFAYIPMAWLGGKIISNKKYIKYG
ncbi:MAG TPA: hypothetical protein EYP87_04915 [Flavobacteriaceae bacterium]|nr:hypothetical protein [Flavobacteriaceae bacterium]HIP48792.1 hypothetical protein [Lutibacter sp.]